MLKCKMKRCLLRAFLDVHGILLLSCSSFCFQSSNITPETWPHGQMVKMGFGQLAASSCTSVPNCKIGFKKILPLVLLYLDCFSFELFRAVLCLMFLRCLGQWPRGSVCLRVLSLYKCQVLRVGFRYRQTSWERILFSKVSKQVFAQPLYS